jgi:pimeloyl-ACP methyl ester carboxylesterase
VTDWLCNKEPRLRLVGVMTTVIVLLGWLQLTVPARAATKLVELPVSFHVRNTNTSGVTCSSDGASYTVRGHISAPRGALTRSKTRSVAVYLTGLDVGEWSWRFRNVRAYNWPRQMAKLGQTSLTIDMLGYGTSGHPPGDSSCYGSQADVTHQIIKQLRNGTYDTTRRARPVRFARIALVGHDVAGAFAQIEAYSYKDIDALIVLTWADQGHTPLILQRSLRAGAVCTAGGENAQPGGPSGYFYAERPDEYRADLFYNADPAVFSAYLRLREPNPCGYEPTTLEAISVDLARLSEIHVPVFLAIGAQDKIWTQQGWAQQRQHFTGSKDVVAIALANTGHYLMLERTAPRLRAIVSDWLVRHRFGIHRSAKCQVRRRQAGARKHARRCRGKARRPPPQLPTR